LKSPDHDSESEQEEEQDLCGYDLAAKSAQCWLSAARKERCEMRTGGLKVSVVIPAINEAACIRSAVSSALRAGALEVIVADGGSSDETRSLAHRAGARVIHARAGRAVQQNAGAQSSVGDVLLFLHADSELHAECIAQIRQSAMRRPLGAFRQRIDAEGRLYRWIERGSAWRAARRGLPYGDQAIFLDRKLFYELGQFPNVPIMEDYLLMRQARRWQLPVLLDGPVLTSARRWQDHGVVRQTLRNMSLVLATRAGIPPRQLATWYPRHDNGRRMEEFPQAKPVGTR
jgi:rSAM/selenodomain-associated transferase 2